MIMSLIYFHLLITLHCLEQSIQIPNLVYKVVSVLAPSINCSLITTPSHTHRLMQQFSLTKHFLPLHIQFPLTENLKVTFSSLPEQFLLILSDSSYVTPYPLYQFGSDNFIPQSGLHFFSSVYIIFIIIFIVTFITF